MNSELSQLDAAIAASEPSAELYMRRGRMLWKMQRHAAAIADYEKAAAIAGPGSPAATALRHARDIMNFYHKDLYNP
ncbi:MAG: tetratricopeptide repeat protein, partial [Muribaculaceae bacterium]|nr:tetratricopeptide repeat protein [Muribaculaceae bacterium]